MRFFDLDRVEDESGVSGTGLVAQGVEFDDGTIALRWLTEHKSTAIYADETTLEKIHGHAGKTKIRWRDQQNNFDRGRLDCAQDGCENAPFGSIGGLKMREALASGDLNVVPSYIEGPWQRAEYARGYVAAATANYGTDWATCSFGWGPAITIGGSPTSRTPEEG